MATGDCPPVGRNIFVFASDHQQSDQFLADLALLLARPVFGLFNGPQMQTGPIDPKACMQTLNGYTLAFFIEDQKNQPASLRYGSSPDNAFIRYLAR